MSGPEAQQIHFLLSENTKNFVRVGALTLLT